MFRLRRPRRAGVLAILEELAGAPFSYDEVGATGSDAELDRLRGYDVDRYGVELGGGDEVFARARDALFGFRMYPEGWTQVVVAGNQRPAPDLIFAAVIRHLGFRSINPGRIIGCVDTAERASFWFGTLPGHSERGEERFSIVRDGDQVRFEVRAFSRPAAVLARLGKPIARALQRRFAADARAQMTAIAGS